MNTETLQRLGDELFEALRLRQQIAPLTERQPDITLDDAYRISQRLLERRLAEEERVVGRKIGVTSQAVMAMLNVHQPDFGFLTDRMQAEIGGEIAIGGLIQPRAEGEIAFILGRDLRGPGVTPEQVLEATEAVCACFEIVDSRIRDWKIKIQDTVADNASCGLFALSTNRVDPRALDLTKCETVLSKNGAVVSRGMGAAVLGSPLNAVAWLANTFGALGTSLKAGEIILSGSAVPLEPIRPGDSMHVEISGLGSASVRFV